MTRFQSADNSDLGSSGGTDHPAVGILGVGLLGGAIAARLATEGFQVTAYDLREFSIANVSRCDSVQSLFASAKTILLSLPTSDVVTKVIREAGEQLQAGQIIIDTTTGKPDEMMSTGRMLEDSGVPYLEANVAGSSELVRQKKAVLFLGGDASVIESLAPLWEAISGKRFHLGPVGSASRFKLVHNMILGLHRLVLAEGLQFAKAQGMDQEQFLEILTQTPAASAVMETKGSQMIQGTHNPPQARLSQHLKDVRLMVEEAEKHGAIIPLTHLHRLLLEQAEQLGLGDSDNSAIVEILNPTPNPPA